MHDVVAASRRLEAQAKRDDERMTQPAVPGPESFQVQMSIERRDEEGHYSEVLDMQFDLGIYDTLPEAQLAVTYAVDSVERQLRPKHPDKGGETVRSRLQRLVTGFSKSETHCCGELVQEICELFNID